MPSLRAHSIITRPVPKRPTDPVELRAIVDLERAGWTRDEVMALLDISLRTYFYRKAEIARAADRSGPRRPRPDDDA